MNRRVVVTGLGVISSLGNTVKENWKNLTEGISGISPIALLPDPSFPVKTAGGIKHFKPADYGIQPKSLKLMNTTIQYAIAASNFAVEDANISRNEYADREIGLSFGVNGIQYAAEEGFLAFYESVNNDLRNYMSGDNVTAGAPIKINDPGLAVHPLWPLSVLSNMSLCQIAIHHSFQGPNLAFSSVDAAGSQAIGEAYKSICQGAGDIYIAGGGYALNTIDILSLSSMDLLSKNQEEIRPFDRLRDGCVLGEGAVVLVLEEMSHALDRGAPVYAEIAGYGSFFNGLSDACDNGNSSTGCVAMKECMSRALSDASLDPSSIDYINADGKGTVQSDCLEAQALYHMFGREVPVSTSKPLTGHMLAANGAFQALSTVLSIKHGIIPPTINCMDQDPQCDIAVVKNALKKQIKYAISNTFGFSEEHTSLVFKHYNQ